jgi:hypothetical protein
MPAEIGHGAASFTDVVTKSGVNQIHGSAIELVRNAAFDAPLWSCIHHCCSHLGQLAYRGGLLTNALGLAAFLIAVVIHAPDVDTSVFGVGFHSFRLKP